MALNMPPEHFPTHSESLAEVAWQDPETATGFLP